jgi:hypothetical protein
MTRGEVHVDTDCLLTGATLRNEGANSESDWNLHHHKHASLQYTLASYTLRIITGFTFKV